MRLQYSFDCTFSITTNRFKNCRLNIPRRTFSREHSGTQLPFRPSILGSFLVIQSNLLMQPETSAKTLRKSLLSSGNNVWYQQVVRAKRVLRETLLAAIGDLAILCADVEYAEAEGEKKMRRFFLYHGPHGKMVACLLLCWSGDAGHLKALLALLVLLRAADFLSSR